MGLIEAWDTQTIADRLCYTRKYVDEQIVTRPDFPLPRRVGGVGRPRWDAAEVTAWWLAQPQGESRDQPPMVGNTPEGN